MTNRNIREVAMNPSAFGGDLKQSIADGIRVGYEFECFMPESQLMAGMQSSEEDDEDYFDDDELNYDAAAKVMAASLEQTYGMPAKIFYEYHESTKKANTWYIEPDGSLEPDDWQDAGLEVVSPPLPAVNAVVALDQFYGIASKLKLYTNESTGLHINISSEKPVDLLKLLVFIGDDHVLQQFNREENDYAEGVLRRAKEYIGEFPETGSTEAIRRWAVDASKAAKELMDEHTSSISIGAGGRYLSLRHAGNDYLENRKTVEQTVGRFIRCMVIAANPDLYFNDYMRKLAKYFGAETETNIIDARANPVEAKLTFVFPKANIPARRMERSSRSGGISFKNPEAVKVALRDVDPYYRSELEKMAPNAFIMVEPADGRVNDHVRAVYDYSTSRNSNIGYEFQRAVTLEPGSEAHGLLLKQLRPSLYESREYPEKPIYYVAYGMLTDPEYMSGVPGTVEYIGKAVLPNYQFELHYYADVVPTAGAYVDVVLWKVDAKSISYLDKTEGYPSLYDRKVVRVDFEGHRVEAFLYNMTPQTRERLLFRLPSRGYLRDVARGYLNAGISTDQLKHALEEIELHAPGQRQEMTYRQVG